MRMESFARVDFSATMAEGANGGVVVTVFGDLDLATVQRLRAVLTDALDTERDIEIDMRGCGFVDSSGIAVLAWAAWRLKEQGRMLRLRGVRPRVKRIFDLAGLGGHSSIVLEPGNSVPR